MICLINVLEVLGAGNGALILDMMSWWRGMVRYFWIWCLSGVGWCAIFGYGVLVVWDGALTEGNKTASFSG
ncbi:hypothetical protein CHI07_03245 [Paenibacillus sp. 7884-2]|nr:hypothetical protein CHI07_03245 [Paenibacillus sp. 7884-2]